MTWLPSPIVLASIGFGTYLVAVGLVTVIGAWWLIRLTRWGWRRPRSAGWTRRYWASLADVPRPAPELPKRYPAPPVQSPRPDLEAALRSRVRALNRDIDHALGSALPGPSQADIEHLITEAIRATRAAANHTS